MTIDELHAWLTQAIIQGYGKMPVCIFDSHNEAHYGLQKVLFEQKEFMFGEHDPEIILALYD